MQREVIDHGHDGDMTSRERPVDRASARGRVALIELGRQLRTARQDAGLSQGAVARACACSGSLVSLVERAEVEGLSIVLLARLLGAVGLDLSVRAYPGGDPIRDGAHRRLLDRFHAGIAPGLGWRTEVPMPIPGDRRAWDAVITAPGCRIGVEAETRPRDVQSLQRRVALKRRDGGVDHVVLLVSATRGNRQFLRDARPPLAADFPVKGRAAMAALAVGKDPGGSAIVVL